MSTEFARTPALRDTSFTRCRVMGIVNVTPDSFSDGGRFATTECAVEHGRVLWAAGADYVDVGGESTRPGAARIDASEESRRVLPVVTELVSAGVAVSIDTTRATVARAAIARGATIVNDVSGGLADPDMARVVAETGVRWVLNHSRGPSRNMYSAATYGDVVREVCDELMMRVHDAIDAGVQEDNLILDPGLGFAKVGSQNWTLLAHLDRIQARGFPVLVGSSRKRFLASVLAVGASGQASGESRPAEDRDAATVATTVFAAQSGAWGVRVHDVSASADAVRVVERLRQ